METTEFQFFKPHDEIRFTANRLPHWQQKGTVYFVTFRLAHALAQHLREQWEFDREAWLRFHPPPWDAEAEREYHERFSAAIERWLDAGHGSCVLRRPDCAGVVAEALRHFDSDRVSQIAWVVMPNHVHAVFVLNPAWFLEKIILSWKGFTARKITPLLGQRQFLAAGLFRSTGSRREPLGQLCSLHQTQSGKGASPRGRVCFVRERVCQKH